MKKVSDTKAERRTSWRDEANCRAADPNLFFPEGTTGPAEEQINAAVVICAACVVQTECLDFALETNQDSGIWGGVTEDDRRRLRKRWLAKRRRSDTEAD